MPTAIKVEGLSEFKTNLKKLDRDLPKALRIALNEAADIVVTGTKSKMPHRSGRAKGSVKARSTQNKARVIEGGNRASYVPWLEFGGRVGKSHGVRRALMSDGRYLYPTYKKASASGEIQDALSKAFVNVARQAGIEVT